MQITFKQQPVHTSGELPSKAEPAPNFSLTSVDLSTKSLSDFKGKKVLLNIFPSLDTGVCAASVRRFNQAASEKDITVLCISADLPFAHNRFCTTEGLENVIPLSVFKSPSFAQDYGVKMTDGPLEGLLARAVVLIDEKGVVQYTEMVPEITQEPDYDKVLSQLN